MYSTMDTYIAESAQQLKTAIEIGKNASISPAKKPIHNILLCGLGGSGIGGSLASSLLFNELAIPMNVNNDYFIPSYVNENTLLIISSYSGNTEETLQAFEEGLHRGAKIVCVSTNGKVEEMANQYNLDYIQIPGGKPPRGALNLSFPQNFFILHKLGLISDTPIEQLQNAVSFLEENQESTRADAKEFAPNFVNRIPIIYCDQRFYAVATRFRQQINENSKMLGWHNVIPEMNHNELVGWTHKNDELAVVFLRNADDYERNQKRMDIVGEVVEKYTPNVYTLWSKGSNFIEQALYMILLTDWISFELAELTGADAVEVNVINYLKGELAKMNG